MQKDTQRWTMSSIGDENVPSSTIGIGISHERVPYKPIAIMECHKGFERCSSFHITLSQMEV